MSAHLTEIFSSIQGEGPYIGYRQVFLRFAGCNLKCAYCDTLHEAGPSFRVESLPGSGVFDIYANPATPSDVAGIITGFNLKHNHSLSLTGGEPLLHAEFIRELRQILEPWRLPFFLETNGTMPDRLAEVIDCLDFISMDIKLPSATKGVALWDAHRKFLKTGARKDIYVKIIVTSETTDEEIVLTSRLIRDVGPRIPLVLQPADPRSVLPEQRITVEQLFRFQEMSLCYINDVRVIPQTHKVLGQL